MIRFNRGRELQNWIIFDLTLVLLWDLQSPILTNYYFLGEFKIRSQQWNGPKLSFSLTLQMQRHQSGLIRNGATYLIFVTSTKHRVHVYTMFMSRMYLGIWEESCIFWYMWVCVINISTYQRMDEIPQALDKAQHFFHTGNRQNLLLEYPGWAVRAGE